MSAPSLTTGHMKHDEFRRRAQRFLTGPFRVDDLKTIFLHLRTKAGKSTTVCDLGNMIGHGDERDRGISVDRVSDLAVILRFQIQRLEQPIEHTTNNLPSELLDVMAASLRQLDNGTLRKRTGLNRRRAEGVFRTIQMKISPKPNGDLAWCWPVITEDERAVINCLTSYIISRPAYDADTLVKETRALFIKHGLMDPAQGTLFAAKRTHLLLFAIAEMHGVTFRLSDGSSVRARAGWDADQALPHLKVRVEVDTLYKGKSIALSVPLFQTDLLADQWADWYSPRQRFHSLDVPLELTDEPLLRVLN